MAQRRWIAIGAESGDLSQSPSSKVYSIFGPAAATPCETRLSRTSHHQSDWPMIQPMNGRFVPEVPRKPAPGISNWLRSCSTRYRFGVALAGGSILYFAL